MNKLFPFLLVILFSACNCNNSGSVKVSNSGDVSLNRNLIQGLDINAILAEKTDILPDMCALVSISTFAKVLGVEESAISLRNSTPSGGNPNHRTCFFKWDDPSFPNTGIMMQAMRNPMPDEFPEYIAVYIKSKKENGENALGDEFVHRFKNLDGMADEGIYNTDIGKYFWRFSDQIIFHIAFNTIHEQEEQFGIATKLGTEMIQNYLGK
ncbi:MAG: hypothetical protein V3V00_08150 [Saprospiraceae bacterium]